MYAFLPFAYPDMKRLFAFLFILAVPFVVTGQDVRPGLNEAVSGSVSGNEVDRFVVQTGDNFIVRGHVNQISVDVIVTVFDGAGKEVARFDGPAVGPESFNFLAEKAGDYRIEVSAFEGKSGEYAFLLEMNEARATDPVGQVNQMMAGYDSPTSPGVALSIWRDGKVVHSDTWGMADLTWGQPFELDTPTNIGSTSKQFTAFAILLLAEDGKLSLDDDVRKHIPELPDFGETVTVRHLLTHTSGYREFLNFLILAGRMLDEGDFIDRAELIEIVQRQPALQNTPGDEWNYNNTAFGLAAVIVERLSGQSFPDFMKERVFAPLGMDHTQVRRSPNHIIAGRAAGYAPDGAGGFIDVRDIGGAHGAGGIYSTVSDLQKWVENMAEPRLGTQDMFAQMMTSFVLNDGSETGYGFGLFIDEQNGLPRVHHGGADMAHRSQLVYYPSLNAGITVQSNHASFNSNQAFSIAGFFFDELDPENAPEPEVSGEFDPASYDPAQFDELAGDYSLDEAPAFILSFFREEATLYTQATGQQRVEIRPTSDSTFVLTAVQASVTFHRNAEGKVNGLTLNQNGQHHATRVRQEGEEDASEEDSEVWRPTLSDFTGRYFSEEAETFYTVVIEEEALVLQHRRLADGKLTPGKEDVFSSGNGPVEFERDRNGQVIAFYLSNGRTRNVRFVRMD
jgi:CubicO group peptidase (beta-lactamase class C family)